MDCGTVKRFVADKDYELYVSKPEVLQASMVPQHSQAKDQQKGQAQTPSGAKCKNKNSAKTVTEDPEKSSKAEHSEKTPKAENSEKPSKAENSGKISNDNRSDPAMDCDKQNHVMEFKDEKVKIEKTVNGDNGIFSDCSVR